jgi:hypothetical protein
LINDEKEFADIETIGKISEMVYRTAETECFGNAVVQLAYGLMGILEKR